MLDDEDPFGDFDGDDDITVSWMLNEDPPWTVRVGRTVVAAAATREEVMEAFQRWRDAHTDA